MSSNSFTKVKRYIIIGMVHRDLRTPCTHLIYFKGGEHDKQKGTTTVGPHRMRYVARSLWRRSKQWRKQKC